MKLFCIQKNTGKKAINEEIHGLIQLAHGHNKGSITTKHSIGDNSEPWQRSHFTCSASTII